MLCLIKEAGSQGAEFAVFPETYIPTYPYWIWLGTPTWGAPFFAELFKNAVEVLSPTTEAMGEAAAKANSYVAMGMNEHMKLSTLTIGKVKDLAMFFGCGRGFTAYTPFPDRGVAVMASTIERLS